jgi:hypothetical protein
MIQIYVRLDQTMQDFEDKGGQEEFKDSLVD